MDEPVRILIVEDLPTDAELAEREIKKTLKSCVFQRVDTREDYLAALEAFRPDLIISDYRMPRFDGLTALRLVLERVPLTPVIILTSAINEDTAVECMKAGAADYVIKEHIKRLGQAVLHALDEKRVRAERQQAEEALRESEKRYRRLFEGAVLGVFQSTPEGGVITVNPAFAHMFGYESPADVIASVKDVAADIFAEPRRRSEIMRLMAERPDLRTFESLCRCKDGSTFTGSLHVWPVKDADGHLRHLEGFVEDITARKQAEVEQERLLAQVQEQARRVQEIMDTVPEGVLLLDSNYRVVLTNALGKKDLATLASAQEGDILTHLGGRPLAELLTSPPGGLWHEVSATNRFFQIIARPIEDGAAPEGWVLVVRDMTHQYEFEKRTQQQERLAAVGQLAAGIAHDFNNILAVITLYAGMLARTPDLSAQTHERLEIIHQQAWRASGLIQQVLDFSRQAVIERRPMDLLPFLKEQVKLLKRILPESIRVEFTYGRDRYTVNADPTRMQQVIMNLAVNARDAMPEGGSLTIALDWMRVAPGEAAPLPEMTPGEWVYVSVCDTGTGIAPDVLQHIFEPFVTTKPPGQGTGLGLPQVYGVVKQHEGLIDFKTQVGEGTTFTLYLPALALSRTQPPFLETEQLRRGHGETILVVEDGAATRQAVVSSLEMLGYRTLEASNGREALAVFQQHAADPRQGVALVLSDVVMPEMGGGALLHALREKDSRVKIVMLSGHPLGEELESLRDQGLNGWLPKPADIQRLAEVVAQALEE